MLLFHNICIIRLLAFSFFFNLCRRHLVNIGHLLDYILILHKFLKTMTFRHLAITDLPYKLSITKLSHLRNFFKKLSRSKCSRTMKELAQFWFLVLRLNILLFEFLQLSTVQTVYLFTGINEIQEDFYVTFVTWSDTVGDIHQINLWVFREVLIQSKCELLFLNPC